MHSKATHMAEAGQHSRFQSISNSVELLFDLVRIQFRVLKFFFFSIVHVLIGTDADAKSALFSVQSLPNGFHADEKKRAYELDGLKRHAFIPPGPHDSRSPCPALNTMANHGYLPREGRRLTGTVLTKALMECYNLSWPLAAFLAWGGVLLLGQVGTLSLHDLARHNRIEHDASVVHENAAAGDEYAPIHPDTLLLNELLQDSRYGTYTVEDIARARVRRESLPGMVLNAVQQEIGRGEFALVLQIFGGVRRMVPRDVMVNWMQEERLPEGWVPETKTTLLGTILVASKIRNAMTALRARLSRTKTPLSGATSAVASTDEKKADQGVSGTLRQAYSSGESDAESDSAYISVQQYPPLPNRRYRK